MEVGILGSLVVRRDGLDVALLPAKQRALLGLFVLRRDEVIATETLVEELWGVGRAPATATKIVHGYVSQLRKALGDGVLETHPGGYRLRLTADQVDAGRFEALLEHGRELLASADPYNAAATLRQALALWRGPPLVEFRFQQFAAAEISRLEELWLIARERRLEAEIALGTDAGAIPELQALAREHPLHENIRRLLMLALYRGGRQAEALAVYREARTALVEELGLDPGAALQRLEAAILVHDPALARAPTPVELAPPAARTGPDPHVVRPARRLPDRPAGRPTRRRRAAVVATAALVVAACSTALLAPDADRTARTVPHTDSVGFIPSGGTHLTARVPLPGKPTSVAVGAGSVWAVDATAGTVSRIDTASRSVVQTIRVGLQPAGIALGAGSVWVANHDDDTVSRISPQTNAVVQTIPVGAGPVAVAYGFGSVWVTNGNDRTLTRLDAATGAVTKSVRTNAVGRGVAVGHGSVWVTDEATDHVVAVDPASGTVTATVTVGSGPTGVAYGAGGVWVVNALDGTVSRIAADMLTVSTTIAIPGGPSSISFAAGAVWVSAEFSVQVFRIDAVRAVVTSSPSVGDRPVALVATAAGAWIATQAGFGAHRGGRLIVLGGGLDSIDPSVGNVNPEVYGPVYDALTSLRSVGGGAVTQLVPDLATALPQPTAAGTSYLFRLRPDLRYSDGRPVRPADIRRGLERVLRLNTLAGPTFAHVVGAADCVRRPTCDLSRGVITTGTSTVTFRLSTPDPSFFEELQVLVPVPPGTPMHDAGTVPVPGTGPYVVQSYVPGRLLTFERNRFFREWSAAARPDGYPDQIVYRVVNSQDAALRQLIAGQADLVQLDTTPKGLAQFAAQHPRQVHVADQQAVLFVFLNTRRPPFNDARARRAVNYAVDRLRVAELYGAALARPTCQIVPPTVSGYRPYCPFTVNPDARGRWSAPDLAEARSLVDASGTRGEHVVLWSFPDFDSEARYIAGVLTSVGYRATIHEVADAGSYFSVLDKTPSAQAGMIAWFGTPLAADLLSTFGCRSDPNPAHFCNTKVDAQLRQLAAREPADPAAAADLAAEIDREITDLAPVVPLITPRSFDITSARVGDYRQQSGLVPLEQLWVT